MFSDVTPLLALYLIKRDVLWMVMYLHGIIGSSVVCNEERPASVVTAVLVTTMEDIAVEEECISCL